MKKGLKITAAALSALLVCGTCAPALAAASVSKDETVFVSLDPGGAVEKQTVSDWLHSDSGLKNFGDVSSLQDITNLKSDELPQQNGTALTWNVDGNDVYYQGTTDGTLPIEAGITYSLDGKAVEPEELAGASGHLVIDVSFTNNAVETKTIDGVDYDICTPYYVLIGTNLSTDHFTNVKAENGTVQTDSTNQIVGFLAMPGMRDTYGDLLDGDLSELRDKLLDEVSIECDMTDGELPSLYIAYSSDLSALDELDDSEYSDEDVNELFDQLDDLKDATQQLIDGAQELADGCSELDEKLGELSSSYVTFNDGIVEACSGAGLLTDGTKQLCSGMRTLSLSSDTLGDGVQQLADGASTLEAGAKQTDEGASSLSSGLSTLDSNSSSLSSGSTQLVNGLNSLAGAIQEDDVKALASAPSSMKAGLQRIESGVESVKSAVKSSLNSAAEAVDAAAGSLTEMDKVEKVTPETATASAAETVSASEIPSVNTDGMTDEQKSQVEALQSAAQANKSAAETNKQAAEANEAAVETNRKAAEANAEKVEEANGQIDKANAQLETAAAAMKAVASKLRGADLSALDSLISGIQKLESTCDTLSSGINSLTSTLSSAIIKLHEGAVSLDNGIAQYTAGVSSAAQGAAQLAAGTKQVSSGASQLSSGINTLGSNVPALQSGVSQLADGAEELDDGADSLSDGMQQLETASATVQDAIQQFDDAGTQLSDGAGTLYDGIVEYDEEGISKITDNETLTNLRTAANIFEEQQDMADRAGCYTGAPASATETTTKYVMRTDEVEQVEVEEADEEDAEEETLWDRIKGLF